MLRLCGILSSGPLVDKDHFQCVLPSLAFGSFSCYTLSGAGEMAWGIREELKQGKLPGSRYLPWGIREELKSAMVIESDADSLNA